MKKCGPKIVPSRKPHHNVTSGLFFGKHPLPRGDWMGPVPKSLRFTEPLRWDEASPLQIMSIENSLALFLAVTATRKIGHVSRNFSGCNSWTDCMLHEWSSFQDFVRGTECSLTQISLTVFLDERWTLCEFGGDVHWRRFVCAIFFQPAFLVTTIHSDGVGFPGWFSLLYRIHPLWKCLPPVRLLVGSSPPICTCDSISLRRGVVTANELLQFVNCCRVCNSRLLAQKL